MRCSMRNGLEFFLNNADTYKYPLREEKTSSVIQNQRKITSMFSEGFY